MASSEPSPTSSYSVAWSSSTLAAPADTNSLAGNVGIGYSPQPPSAVSPRSVTENCPADADPATGSGSGTWKRSRWSADWFRNDVETRTNGSPATTSTSVSTGVGTVSSLRTSRSEVSWAGQS